MELPDIERVEHFSALFEVGWECKELDQVQIDGFSFFQLRKSADEEALGVAFLEEEDVRKQSGHENEGKFCVRIVWVEYIREIRGNRWIES